MSKTFKDLKALKDLFTPEMLDEIKQENVKKNKEQSLEYQLGYYVGEYIVHTHLPTLSIDVLHTRKIIEVSAEDATENKKLYEEWYDTAQYSGEPDTESVLGDTEKWLKYSNHTQMLERKYLPHTLVCYLSPLNVGDMLEFKKGLSSSLWNCDMCSYDVKPENITVYDDPDGNYTTVSLFLDTLHSSLI